MPNVPTQLGPSWKHSVVMPPDPDREPFTVTSTTSGRAGPIMSAPRPITVHRFRRMVVHPAQAYSLLPLVHARLNGQHIQCRLQFTSCVPVAGFRGHFDASLIK